MRSRCVRLIAAVICCTVVAVAGRPSRASAQGMVVPRGPLCAPPPPCRMGSVCVARLCVGPMGSVVARNSSRVHADLADHVLRYEVTETFVNRGARLGEADYLFPLPAGAAFQDLKLSINGELVAGEVLDAPQARGIYEEIVRRQRDPALVEWIGSGLLHARIFPIAPGEEKTVVVRFQTVVRREGDAFRIDYTRAAMPDNPVWTGAAPGTNPPPSSEGAGESRYSFTLSYPSGGGYGTAYSPTHSLVTDDNDGGRRTVRATGNARDITILLPVARATAAAVTMLPYAPGDGPGFTLITVAPPAVHAKATPRDMTFVLDVSGSMSGRKIEQARAAGRDLLGTLTPQDRFRLIDFSTDVRTFRDEYQRATPEHVREAEHYLDQLEAEGSTNIEGALRRALQQPDAEDARGEISTGDRLPIVLFITDGEPTIGEQSPDALVAQAESHLGHTRLFTFGLGADVNTSLLEQLALHGRGTAQFVRPDESVERAVSLVAHRLTDPVITDVVVHADGVRLTEMLPETAVDLFAGQDLVLLARYQGNGPARLRFTGRTASGPISWESDVTFPDRERANSFVARLWATQRVGYLEAARHKNGPSAELDAELKQLGTRFGIPTELTSYLVQEPSFAANTRPMDGRFSAGVAGGAANQVAPPPTGSRNAPNAVSVVESFKNAKVAAAQRAVTTLSAADSVATLDASQAGRGVGVRRAGGRTFAYQDSVWTDTRFTPATRVVRVAPFSAAYFSLIQAVPDLRAAFAVGDRVLVAGVRVAVEVSPAGATELSDSDVAGVRADW
jgi:Ca-activated chloride channel family protein